MSAMASLVVEIWKLREVDYAAGCNLDLGRSDLTYQLQGLHAM